MNTKSYVSFQPFISTAQNISSADSLKMIHVYLYRESKYHQPVFIIFKHCGNLTSIMVFNNHLKMFQCALLAYYFDESTKTKTWKKSMAHNHPVKLYCLASKLDKQPKRITINSSQYTHSVKGNKLWYSILSLKIVTNLMQTHIFIQHQVQFPSNGVIH